MKKNISVDELKELALKYPNDMQLGEQIRKMVWSKDDNYYENWRIKQFNRNRAIEDQVSTIEEMENRIDEIFNS
tara:strand:- start:336 stop:557 length:222 start_codon:yes stop_codon:yes gene_type:complete